MDKKKMNVAFNIFGLISVTVLPLKWALLIQEPSVSVRPLLVSCLYSWIPCVGKILRTLGSCAELLLLHFSSFTIGRRLEVTVGSEEENLLQPCVPYTPSEASRAPAKPAHVVTVCAPKDTPRYQINWCLLMSEEELFFTTVPVAVPSVP